MSKRSTPLPLYKNDIVRLDDCIRPRRLVLNREGFRERQIVVLGQIGGGRLSSPSHKAISPSIQPKKPSKKGKPEPSLLAQKLIALQDGTLS